MTDLRHIAISKRLANKMLATLAAFVSMVLIAVTCLDIATNAVSIYDGDDVIKVYTLSDEPDSILNQAGVKLDSNDEYSYEGLSGKNGKIKVTRAFKVNVDVYGTMYILKTNGGTVQDALDKVGVEINEHDYVNYELDEKLTPNMVIDVTKVDITTEQQSVELPYSSEVVYSDTLAAGTEKITTKGCNGVKTVTFSHKSVDGKVVSSEIVDETVTVEPVNEVKTIGTKVPTAYTVSNTKYISSLTPSSDFALDANGVPTSYSRVITGKASAYSGGTRTSTGKKPQTGYVAVNPKVIPYGSRLFIRCTDGSYIYGYAVAADTGSFIHSTNRVVDLYFSTRGECIRFGVRNVEIYVLD